jgi:hypothetical protein
MKFIKSQVASIQLKIEVQFVILNETTWCKHMKLIISHGVPSYIIHIYMSNYKVDVVLGDRCRNITLIRVERRGNLLVLDEKIDRAIIFDFFHSTENLL